MIKSELIERVAAAAPRLTRQHAEGVVNAIFAENSGGLLRSEHVALRGFGSFTARLRPAREARNPRTGEVINVEESHAAVFKGGKELCDRIKEGCRPAAKPAKTAAATTAPAKAAKPEAKAKKRA